MTYSQFLRAAACAATFLAATTGGLRAAPSPEVVALFQDWRNLVAPERTGGVSDFGAAALEHKRHGLAVLRRRASVLSSTLHGVDDDVDLKLIAAEMNGLEFDLRVRRPWARDPSYFATVFGEESDVPAHEGPSADVIDLFKWHFPLAPEAARQLALRLRSVPPLLERARGYLAHGDAADLWRYGDRAFAEQEDVLLALQNGTLRMRTIEGHLSATLEGAPDELRVAVRDAIAATHSFRVWVRQSAGTKTGPSGVGIDNYNWYMKNVQLVPYDWAGQEALLRRELERAYSGLEEEELRNRALPPLVAIDDPVRYQAYDDAEMEKYIAFLTATGLIPDRNDDRAALRAQKIGYVPSDARVFFTNITALNPLPLYSHDIHWVELAKIRYAPNPDPVRAGAPLFNIYAARSEGLATGFEELVMRAGLYEAEPRGRELVWIMLANRAARGLASLYVQANRMTLDEAGFYHASHTPRGYSDARSPLVGGEQLLYLRQPGYGTSYVTGKALFDAVVASAAQAHGAVAWRSSLPATMNAIYNAGILPWPLVAEVMGLPPKGVAP